MKKWLTLLLLMLVTVSTATAICCERNKDCIVTETCQDAACGDCSIIVYNPVGSVNMTQQNMTLATTYTYHINLSRNLTIYGTYPYTIECSTNKTCEGDCQIEYKKECEEEQMEGLAVTIFIMVLNIGLFLLPFRKLSQNDFLNYILKRCCVIIGLLMISLNAAIVATIADTSGLNVLNELFRYIFLVNWAAYISMAVLCLTTIFGVLRMWNIEKDRQRMGGDSND